MRTISEHILDIIQNSIRAKATLIEIIFEEEKKKDLCILKITDNGCGMDEESVRQATNPFFTSRKTRKVGLGLALLKQSAEQAEGSFQLHSEIGEGTRLEARFKRSGIDRQPLGDIWETFFLCMLSYPHVQLSYSHKTDDGSFTVDSNEIRIALGDVPLQNKEIKTAIIELIKNNLIDIKAIK